MARLSYSYILIIALYFWLLYAYIIRYLTIVLFLLAPIEDHQYLFGRVIVLQVVCSHLLACLLRLP